MQLTEDRRNSHAAELVVAAWRARQTKRTSDVSFSRPEFVIHLEAQLLECCSGPADNVKMKDGQQSSAGKKFEPLTSESISPEVEADAISDLDFQDIDWSFWNNLD